MGLFKCCVGGCKATSDTHRLFSFPKNDKLRDLWLSFLVPTNPILIGLSENQLRRKRVCEKHFDKHQFDKKGRRLRQSYPCLFTEIEIAHGEPLSSTETAHNVLKDHTYFREKCDEDGNVADTLLAGRAVLTPLDEHSYSCKQSYDEIIHVADNMLVIENAGPSFNEQPSCSYSQTLSSITDSQKVTTFKAKVERKTSKQDKNTLHCQGSSVLKTMDLKKKKYIKHVTKIASDSLGDKALHRLEKAVLHLSSERLFNNFSYLSKQAQTFLIMQLKQCRINKMGRRFTLDEKLIALALMKQSPKSYRLLENMFNLPNKRTLNRLSEKNIIEPGLNTQIFEYIQNKTRNWDTHKKLCTIVFDEISLTPHLTFNEKNDIIYGFVDVAEERKMKFSDHALVFMLRGVCDTWRQSVAFYFCEGTVSAAALQNILKQLVSKVVQAGFIPLGLVCDQGTTFRTAIKALREDTIQMRTVHKVKDDGTVRISGQDMSVFYDPPHLLKGLRNNFLNKNIIWEGKTASWKDIEFIYDLDCTLGHTRTLPKLTAHHVNPNKIKKMKVNVAAQVFSAKTAAMLKYTNALNNLHNKKSDSMETTAEVVEFVDTLFDSVNCFPGGAVRGKLRRAVKINSPHQKFWEEAINKIKKMKFLDANSKIAIQAGKPRLVRVPSLEGWITTLESFLRISKLLFLTYDVDYYYPRLINQDPLENFFGRIRALNCRNINPDANTFLYSFKSLLLTNLLSPHSKFANCQVDNGETLLDINFLFNDKNNENKDTNSPLTSFNSEESRKSLSKDEVTFEKIKVQTSAYTAGYICRKLSKTLKCKSCLRTFTSSSTEEKIFSYINFRKYKMLKNNNLVYPTEKILIMYRDASTYIHSYLNANACKKNVGKKLKQLLESNLRFSWLGCCIHHSLILKNSFIKLIIRLHVHNWCNIINKILKGDLEAKYVNKMCDIQKTAYKKYQTYRLRKKAINK